MDLESKCFSTPFHWSSEVLIITIVTVLVLVLACIHLELKKWPETVLWLKYTLMLVMLATIVIGIGHMPLRLKADDKTVSVKRAFGSIVIPQSQIVEIRQIAKSDITGSIRTFGSGGLFGYLGRFKSDRLGSYTMYATDMKHLILIRTNEKNYVFNCSRSNELIEMVMKTKA